MDMISLNEQTSYSNKYAIKQNNFKFKTAQTANNFNYLKYNLAH